MKKIIIQEVGTRDGFQNLEEFIETKDKLKVIDGLIKSGVKDIQITSFVSPKAIPQMKDAKEVALYCTQNYKDVNLFALVPNLRGATTAVETGIDKISYVISLSVSHNKANINRTHEESIEELEKIIKEYPNLKITLDVATAFGCPFEGIPKEEDLINFMQKIYGMGIRDFCLCDTVGLATPNVVRNQIKAVQKTFKDVNVSVHIHDTRGMGLVNTLAAIEEGVDTVQSTLGGLGGCPFAPGASGNTSTEDLVYMLKAMGYDTGINSQEIINLAKDLKESVKGSYSGHLINI